MLKRQRLRQDESFRGRHCQSLSGALRASDDHSQGGESDHLPWKRPVPRGPRERFFCDFPGNGPHILGGLRRCTVGGGCDRERGGDSSTDSHRWTQIGEEASGVRSPSQPSYLCESVSICGRLSSAFPICVPGAVPIVTSRRHGTGERRRVAVAGELVPGIEVVSPRPDEASPTRESSACRATAAYQGHAEPFGSAQGRLREASLPTTGSESNPRLALRPLGRQRFFPFTSFRVRMTPYWRRGVEQRPNDPPGASPRLGNRCVAGEADLKDLGRSEKLI